MLKGRGPGRLRLDCRRARRPDAALQSSHAVSRPASRPGPAGRRDKQPPTGKRLLRNNKRAIAIGRSRGARRGCPHSLWSPGESDTAKSISDRLSSSSMAPDPARSQVVLQFVAVLTPILEGY